MKKHKKIIILIMVLLLLWSSSINVLAWNPPAIEESARQGRMLTPFNLTYHASVNAYDDQSYNFVVDLPSYFISSTDRSEYNFFQTTMYNIDGSSVGMDITSFQPSPYTDFFEGDAITYLDLEISAIGIGFDDVGSFMLQDCFLWPDISIEGRTNPGTVFAIYQESARMNFADGYSKGEFYLPGVDQSFTYNTNSQNTIQTGAFLNYYQVLCYSNVPWADYLPDSYETYTPDQFTAMIEVAKLVGFEDMTDDQLLLLDQLFSWVGPIYGRFEVSDSVSNDVNPYRPFISYSLTNFSELESFYVRNVEEARYNGLTGFERMTKFLGSAVNGFMTLEIMPGFSLGGILVVLITFSIVLWWLKVFAGG